MRNPASKELISESVEMWDTGSLLLAHPTDGEIVRLPKMLKDSPRGRFRVLKGRQQSLSLEINPVDNAEQCCPHDNIVYGINLANRLSHA